MLGVLGLIDVVMIANPAHHGDHRRLRGRSSRGRTRRATPTSPEWLSHVNAGILKVKLATALIGISSIHLLKTFIDVDMHSDKEIVWQVAIHLTFVASALILAWIERARRRRIADGTTRRRRRAPDRLNRASASSRGRVLRREVRAAPAQTRFAFAPRTYFFGWGGFVRASRSPRGGENRPVPESLPHDPRSLLPSRCSCRPPARAPRRDVRRARRSRSHVRRGAGRRAELVTHGLDDCHAIIVQADGRSSSPVESGRARAPRSGCSPPTGRLARHDVRRRRQSGWIAVFPRTSSGVRDAGARRRTLRRRGHDLGRRGHGAILAALHGRRRARQHVRRGRLRRVPSVPEFSSVATSPRGAGGRKALVLGGWCWDGHDGRFVAARLNTDGTQDASFDATASSRPISARRTTWPRRCSSSRTARSCSRAPRLPAAERGTWRSCATCPTARSTPRSTATASCRS